MAKKKQQTWAELTAVSTKSANWIIHNVGFVLFLGFVALVYIANNHYAQKTRREITELQEQLEEKRRIYNALSAEVEHRSKKGEVLKRVEGLGLRLGKEAPKKIVVVGD